MKRRRSNHKVKGEDRQSYQPTAVHTLIARFNLVKRMFPLGDLSIISPPSRQGMNEIVTDHATCPTKPDGWARVRWAVNGSFASEVSYKVQGIFLHVIYPDVEYDRSPVPAVRPSVNDTFCKYGCQRTHLEVAKNFPSSENCRCRTSA